MNRLLHFLIAGLICLIADGQSKSLLDSLRKQLDKDLSEIDRIKTYLKLTEVYIHSDSSLAVQYGDKAIEWSRSIKYYSGEIDALNHQGFSFMTRGNYDRAERLFNQAIELAKENKYMRGEISGYIGLGSLAKFQGDYDESIKFLNQSLLLSQKNKYKDLEGKTYLSLGNTHLYLGKYDHAKECFEKSIDFNEDLGLTTDQGKSYLGLGSLYFYQGSYDSALNYYFTSLETYEKHATYQIALTLDNIGLVYLDKSNFRKALDYCLQSLSLSDKHGYQEIMAGSLNNIGLVYAAMGDHRKALDYHQKSLAIREVLNDQQGKYASFGNIGISYRELGELNCALDFMTKSMLIAERISDKWGMASIYNYIGEAYLELNQSSHALNYFHKSERIFDEIGANSERILPLIGIGKSYKVNNKLNDAQEILKEALELARESGRRDLIKSAAEELAHTERRLGNMEKALDAYILSREMEDSVLSEANTKEIARLEVEYEYQQEKDSIEFANAALRLTLENDIQKREIKQRTFLIVVIFLVALLIVLFFFYRLKLKTAATLGSLNQEIKTQNVSLEEKKNELEYANKSKSRFFSIIAHDLRDPLNAISSFNKILNEHLKSKYDISDDSRFSVLLWHFENSIDQISSLLNQLLTWAIKDEGLLQYNPENVNLKQACEENFEIFQPLAKTKNISLKYSVEDSLFIYVDRSSFMTILRNLTSNALKFTREGGKVNIKAKKCSDTILVFVEDNGVGIPPERLNKIYSLEASKLTTDLNGKKGTGLGLMLVKDLVKMNQGSLEVKSKIDEGTSFMISLPPMA